MIGSTIKAIVTAIFACGVAAAVWAGANLPSGWAESRNSDTVIWQSPPTTGGTRVLIIFGSVEKASGTIDAWFNAQVADLNKEQDTTVSNRLGVKNKQNLTYDVFDLTQDGETYRAFAFAYDTTLGKQMILVMTLGTLDVNDTMLQSAFDEVGSLLRQRVANPGTGKLVATKPDGKFRAASGDRSSAPANSPPVSQPPSQPSSSGGRCREELRTITTMQLQQVCYPSAGGMSNCQLQSVPVQREVYQTQCY